MASILPLSRPRQVADSTRPSAAHERPDGTVRPIGVFVHHQGKGHAKRCEAILCHVADRPVTVFTADPSIITIRQPNVSVIGLPEMIARPSRTGALHGQLAPHTLHCAPVGVREMTEHMGIIAQWMVENDPALMLIDVSAEIATLCRIMSVPVVQTRMHGDRGDAGHVGAYECCVGMLAPFDERIEQPDYPAHLRARTFYSGGLCTTTAPVPSRAEARAALGLPEDGEIVLALSGGGGSGTPLAPLTMAARARTDALWLIAGPVAREGHETEFHNLRELGWVPNPIDYVAAADLVIASAGDNTVHEIARVGRPFLCIPEWRYFDEQRCKAEQLARLGAAAVLPGWPASTAQWLDAMAAARRCDLDMQRALFDADAGEAAARWLLGLADELWREAAVETPADAAPPTAAKA